MSIDYNTTQQLAASPVCAGWNLFQTSHVPVLQLVQTLIPESPRGVVHVQRHFHAQAEFVQ